MRCLIRMSMLSFVGLSLSSCTTMPAPVADTFCTLYERVVQDKGDGASLAGAKSSVKKRILLNEQQAKTCS